MSFMYMNVHVCMYVCVVRSSSSTYMYRTHVLPVGPTRVIHVCAHAQTTVAHVCCMFGKVDLAKKESKAPAMRGETDSIIVLLYMYR